MSGGLLGAWGSLLPPVAALGLLATGWWLSRDGYVAPGLLSRIGERAAIAGTLFVGIFLEALPFLLIGVIASAVLRVWVPDALLARVAPRRLVPAAALGVLLGLVAPVCECGAIAISRSLVRNGTSVPMATALMLSAPVVNPITLAATWVAFGGNLEIVLGRLLLGAGTAIVVGILLGLHPDPRAVSMPAQGICCGGDHGHADDGAMSRFLSTVTSELFDLGKLLVAGALATALIQTFVPRAIFLEIGDQAGLSVLALMGLAALLSICSTVDAFVALAFLSYFNTDAIVAFLVIGPMVNLKSVLLYSRVLRPGVVILLAVACAQLTFLGASVVRWTLP